MTPLRPLFCLVLACLAITACRAPSREDTAQSAAPPLFDTFGDLHRDIGTRVPEAQRYFDQGLRLAYGFNHEAAARAFAEAERLDPECAMCAWGQALVLGPNINLPMSPDLAADATTLALRAQQLAKNATPADQALIAALVKRYTTPAPADRKPLDEAYAQAMGEARKQFPDDDDIAALYAESLMDLTPWAYWNAQGQPTEYTDTIVTTLESVLKRNPRHIGAAHYFIHAVEASNEPQRAEPYADRLAALAPGSGHLVHMPAHVYIRVGRYHDATLSNLAASTADKAFLAVCRGSNGAYPLGYVPHNWHFAAMTAALHGSRTLAIEAADQTAQRTDPQQMEAMAFMQQFVVAPLFARVRFGEWQAILAQDEPPSQVAFPRAIWHFARGMALVRTDQPAQARKELQALQAIAKDPAMEKVVLFDINRADRVLDVAQNMLAGEIALSTKQTKAGLDFLRKAVASEDLLNYNEPPDWPLPVRPYLGAALLDAGRAKEAVAVYEQDLKRFPENGWSLYGLAQAQKKLKLKDAAADSERRQAAAWQWADVKLVASRF
jgi:tetratricopeptide (TPR) repeat protein